jgi:hypothetical protein
MTSSFYVAPGDSIQDAVSAASSQGGGRVVLLPGRHDSGTIYLESFTELHLPAGAVLSGGTSQEDYDALPDDLYAECHNEPCNRALLAAANAEGIAITGCGVIEGNGPEFYDRDVPPDARHYRKPTEVQRPRMLHFANCRNVTIEGVHFHDSPRWTLWFIECDDVTIRRVRITGDPRMINNDGIHFFGGKRIAISDCFVSTGDDALVVRSGHAWHDMDHRVVLSDMVVSNCVFESACQAIRVGCPGDDLIENCRFSNLILKGRNGIHLDNPLHYWEYELATPFRQTPHEVRKLYFDNITIAVSAIPIQVAIDKGVEIGPIDEVGFSQIRLEGGEPVVLRGWEKAPLGTIRLDHVSGVIDGPIPLQTEYVTNLIMNDINLQTRQP